MTDTDTTTPAPGRPIVLSINNPGNPHGRLAVLPSQILSVQDTGLYRLVSTRCHSYAVSVTDSYDAIMAAWGHDGTPTNIHECPDCTHPDAPCDHEHDYAGNTFMCSCPASRRQQ